MKTLADIGEDHLISLLCPEETSPQVIVGPGDDCAVIDTPGEYYTLLKTDAVVEGVHFLSEELPKRVGWKAVARVLSDFAAMGGEPRELMITIALPSSTPVSWVTELYQGMRNCLAQHGGLIVGGETTSVPAASPKVISVSGRGQVRKDYLVTRSGGKPGDKIYVTGRLGGSIQGKHLDFTPRIKEAQFLTENAEITAMMDLSDGLATDLPRLAKLSGCGFHVEENNLPVTPNCTPQEALSDGEDYELLIIGNLTKETLALWNTSFASLPLSHIGTLSDKAIPRLDGGWTHFKEA